MSRVQDETQLQLMQYDGDKWVRYTLQQLPKILVQNIKISQENKADNDWFPSNNGSTLNIECVPMMKLRFIFFSSEIDETLLQHMYTLHRRSFCSTTHSIDVVVLPQDGMDRECQDGYSIQTFSDFKFIKNVCYITTDDLLQVIHIVYIILEYITT